MGHQQKIEHENIGPSCIHINGSIRGIQNIKKLSFCPFLVEFMIKAIYSSTSLSNFATTESRSFKWPPTSFNLLFSLALLLRITSQNDAFIVRIDQLTAPYWMPILSSNNIYIDHCTAVKSFFILIYNMP